MADYAIHEETLVDVSNVIRKKDGTSALIDPADYAERINLMGMLEEKTVSGTIAHFDDGADAVPLKGLVANLPASLTAYEEVKITHAGKNLLPNTAQTTTENGVTFTVNSDGSVSLSGTCSADTNFYIYSGFIFPKLGQYFFSGCPSGGSTSTYRVFLTNFGADVGNGYLLNVSNLSTTTSVRINIKAGTVTDGLVFKPQIEVGSTASTFEAYQAPTEYEVEIPNPNPNLFDKTAEHDRATWNTDGSLNTDNYDHFAYRIAVEEKTDYTIDGQAFDRTIVFFDSSANFISYVSPTMTDNKMKVTTPTGAVVMGISMDFIGALASDNAITKDFNVYGGSIDVVSGTGINGNRKFTVLNTPEWSESINYKGSGKAAYIQINSGPASNNRWQDLVCSHFTPANIYAGGTQEGIGCYSSQFYIRDSRFTSKQDFLDFLTEQEQLGTPLEICYKLLNPATFTFDPVPIDSKAGTNNIWNDSGDTEVTYRSQGTVYQYPKGEGVSF